MICLRPRETQATSVHSALHSPILLDGLGTMIPYCCCGFLIAEFLSCYNTCQLNKVHQMAINPWPTGINLQYAHCPWYQWDSAYTRKPMIQHWETGKEGKAPAKGKLQRNTRISIEVTKLQKGIKHLRYFISWNQFAGNFKLVILWGID